MDDIIKSFEEYRTNKRQEITSMRTIIASSRETLNKKEQGLLIASYIVLSYAYWESCFDKFRDLLFEKYKFITIKQLPFNLKNAVYLKFAEEKLGESGKKMLKELSSHKIFDNVYEHMHRHEDNSLHELGRADNFKQIFIKKTFTNPTMELLRTLLKEYDVNLDETIKAHVEARNIASFFEHGLAFLIAQRHAVAHKNEKIMYSATSFDSYDDCIAYFKENVVSDPPCGDAEDFIYEMTFQIDSFYRIMVDTLINTEQ